jgi:salicylate hydroxylase
VADSPSHAFPAISPIASPFLRPTRGERSIGNSVSAYLGPSAHLVCYPLQEKPTRFNMVAITTGTFVARLARPADASQRQQLLSRFSRWNGALLSLLRQAGRR